MERKQLIEALRKSGPQVVAYFEADADLLEKTYAPGKWTVRDLLVHLTDAEFMYLGRVCTGLAEPGGTVQGFDQDKWKATLKYNERPLHVCRALFDGAREQLIDLLGRFPDSALDNVVTHSEGGPMSLRKILTYLAWHSDHHLEQIDAARAGQVWKLDSSAVGPAPG